MILAVLIVIVGTVLLVRLILRAERAMNDDADRRPSSRRLTGSLWLWEQDWRRSSKGRER